MVSTSLLTEQLGWRPGVEILERGRGPRRTIRQQVVDLHSNTDLWQELRRGGLKRVRRDYSRTALRRALARALGLEPT